MVPDMDWELGLQVWNKFYTFPHPIASTPDVIPPLEDLVDIVIARPYQPSDKSEKKKKKGCRGKKKEKRKGKDKAKDGEKASDNSSSQGGAEKAELSQKEGVTEAEDGEEIVDKDDSNELDEVTDIKAESADNDCNNSAVTGESSKKETKLCNIPSPKTVVIRKHDPNREQPNIEIKVLDHGLAKNVFPLPNDSEDLDENEREDEPMDVDQSLLNASRVSVEQDDASQFASSVIEKLNSPTRSPNRDIPQSKPRDENHCSTPPPTPVGSLGHPAFSPVPRQLTHFGVGESSVDPAPVLTGIKDEELPESTPTEQLSVLNIEDMLIAKDNYLPKLTEAEKELLLLVTSSDKPSVPPTSAVEPPAKEAKPKPKKERDPTKPTFRVTCNRVGEGCHKFDSGSAAACLGSAIITYFGWSVDLKNFDIEVSSHVSVSIKR